MIISVEARQIGGCVAGLHFHTGWLDFSKHTLFSTPNLISIGRVKHVWSPITAAFVLQLHGYLCRAKHHQGYHEQPMWFFFIFLKVLATQEDFLYFISTLANSQLWGARSAISICIGMSCLLSLRRFEIAAASAATFKLGSSFEWRVPPATRPYRVSKSHFWTPCRKYFYGHLLFQAINWDWERHIPVFVLYLAFSGYLKLIHLKK